MSPNCASRLSTCWTSARSESGAATVPEAQPAAPAAPAVDEGRAARAPDAAGSLCPAEASVTGSARRHARARPLRASRVRQQRRSQPSVAAFGDRAARTQPSRLAAAQDSRVDRRADADVLPRLQAGRHCAVVGRQRVCHRQRVPATTVTTCLGRHAMSRKSRAVGGGQRRPHARVPA
jgi:hypothetical protein